MDQASVREWRLDAATQLPKGMFLVVQPVVQVASAPQSLYVIEPAKSSNTSLVGDTERNLCVAD